MKNYFVYLLVLLSFQSNAQVSDSTRQYRLYISIGPGITIGEFTDTHPFSINADFGYRIKKFGLKLGIYHFLGNSQDYSGYSYNFDDYSVISLTAGYFHELSKRVLLSIHAGPVMTYYSNEFEGGFDISAGGLYSLKKKFGISPSLHWIQLSKSDPIIFFTVMLSRSFR